MTKKYIVSLALLIAHITICQCANQDIKKAVRKNPAAALKKHGKEIGSMHYESRRELWDLAEDLLTQAERLFPTKAIQKRSDVLHKIKDACNLYEPTPAQAKAPIAPKQVAPEARPAAVQPVKAQPVKPQSPFVHPASPMGVERQLLFELYERAKQVRIGQLTRISKVTWEFEKFEQDNY